MKAKTKQWLMWGSVLIVATVALFVVTRSGSHAPDVTAPDAVDIDMDVRPAGAGALAEPGAASAATAMGGRGADAAGHAPSPVPAAAKPVEHDAVTATPGREIAAPRIAAPRPGASAPAPAGQAPPPDPEPGEIDREDGNAPGGGGGFHDRTGRGGNLARQLNQNLLPLASECIEMAKERNPELAGMLSIAINLVPAEGDKVLVGSVELQEDNEIDDPELFECIEQSSFSLEGLETSESFAITMPIAPDQPDQH